jgi:FkbM family methyltransferase
VPESYLWERLKRVETAIDVGAHIGVWTRNLKRLFPRAEVLCVEPHPGNFRLLRRNVYGLRAVMPICTAVQYSAPFYRLHTHQVNSGGHTTEPLRADEQGNGEAETLESLIDWWGWGRCDLLKLDCEGAEVDIIQNADLTLFKQIVGEYHAGVMAFDVQCRPALETAHFRVEVFPHPNWPDNGIFFAEREA